MQAPHKTSGSGRPPPSTTDSLLPDLIESEAELDDVLTRPSRDLIEEVAKLSSPLVILGAGGKMGPTLAVLARRAADASGVELEVVAVSRFSDGTKRRWLEERDVRTIECDLLDSGSLEQLPDAENIVYLVGLKFGTHTNPSATWAINTLVPAQVCRQYAGSRIVALSTGNVYPPVNVESGGSLETDALTPPGEYANAAVGRERIFEYCAACHRVSVALVRLFYATELRYGVVRDIAHSIHTGTPVPLANGCFNCIWQGDANSMILRSFRLAASPPQVWNLCLPETFRVRTVANMLGVALGREPQFSGAESDTALLGNSGRICAALGTPPTGIERIARWTAHWVAKGGRSFDKPTHFDVRNGQY